MHEANNCLTPTYSLLVSVNVRRDAKVDRDFLIKPNLKWTGLLKDHISRLGKTLVFQTRNVVSLFRIIFVCITGLNEYRLRPEISL